MKELELILKSIKNKTLLPMYFFHGEEPYFMDIAVKAFENELLEEDEKAFGQTVVYGKDTSLPEIIAAAQQFPMFGNINLIIVKEAQDLKFTEDQVPALEHYIENPVETTVLVFAHKHKKIDTRRKFSKLLTKNKYLHLSESLKEYQLARWIAEECANMGIQTAPNISHLLAEYLGNDLSRIANELNKLKLILQEGEILDSKMVEKHIGISKDYNVFELQKALGTKNAAKAMQIVHYIGKSPKNNPLPMMMGNLYNYFSNLIIFHTMHGASQQELAGAMGVNPYFVKDFAEAARYYPLKHLSRIISLLRDTDMKSKGLGSNQTDDAELFQELIYKILFVDQLKVKT
ncbi:DNA polymerase III subunit delta [Chryseobacterium sp. MFBS3-17]|uniref:DNA polymerase III subunit delta n=1 Tax=Chryseobacterium sp. MFBS3-17 TaxID=2886689 RepID=UPI001D0F485E|nr:DNA polymerase III subunit delta [Chryseobacterium sp. MFBS3-17]MCC2590128.1 DNA polymerase III subunit delta [Chryseobacterium sp. MFBS3-17]